MKHAAKVARIARERFGFHELRNGQMEAIESVLNGRDTLAVMPTGSGKSAIYQIPAVMMPGPTVVVSPLIALQKDQIDSLEQQEVAPAAVVNSVIPESEKREAFEDLGNEELEFIFMAPEQFNKKETLERLQKARPSLFVVDEAHCISEWGHDFRPDYLRLGAVVEALGHPTILALTATANPDVREEIAARLGMRDPVMVVRGFDRPNIWLGVRAYPTEKAKREALIDEIENSPKPGIVYVSSRRHAEEIANHLNERGIKTLHYHGGMRGKEREPVHSDFMEGECDVMVATSAFGMGVDKPNVRFVYHYDAPDSLDSYYQEIGRAGRDGEPARAVLFYRPEDLNIHRFFKGGGKVDEREMSMVAGVVEKHEEPVDLKRLQFETGLSKIKLTRALTRLEETGVLRKLPTGEVESAPSDVPLHEAAEKAAAEQRRLHEHSHLRLQKMQAYAELLSCRREYLLHHFGENYLERCDRCDNCEAPASDPQDTKAETKTARAGAAQTAAQPVQPTEDEPFPVRSRVSHSQWGKGVVEGYESGKIVVLFDETGKKTLSLDAVVENGLLEAAG